jgi:ATP-dependent Clp protease ATP-binding subunit ClpX
MNQKVPVKQNQIFDLRARIEAIPIISPPDVFRRLDELGYKGQEHQRKAVSLMAYRHVRRIKRLYLEGVPQRELPPKHDLLLLGPTGCGKTFLVELLFQHIFALPTVVIDITGYTESGYIGDSVSTIITRLINAAGDNRALASIGVVCLDEFDKLASSSSNARFAGQGTTKDVSGYGVQRELLAMIEGADVLAPMDYGFSEFGERLSLNTRNVPFIACGAFSGMDELLKSKPGGIGFGNPHHDDDEQLTVQEAASFQKFGFLPELIGRFSRIVPFPALPAETLSKIMRENILPQFTNEFAGEGLKLMITDAAVDHVVKDCLRRGTGARGLNAEVIVAVEKAAYDNFMQNKNAEVVIDAKEDGLESEVRDL